MENSPTVEDFYVVDWRIIIYEKSNMNVGSILNDDTPHGGVEKKPEEFHKKPDIQANDQRHSIVNLLNDPQPVSSEDKNEQKGSTKELKQENVPEEQPHIAQKSSISDLTNDSNDNNTGKSVSSAETSANDDKESSNGNDKGDVSSAERSKTKEELAEDELQRIHKLRSSSKPKRYRTPPIWAQEWVTSAVNVQRDFSAGSDVSILTDKRVFDPTSTVSVDLECSITGVIPPPSVTRTIAEWIYANFNEIPDDNRKYVELELKFGTIIDKKNSHRININVSTECIYTDTSGIYFDMGVHEVGWNEMCQFLDSLEKSYQNELRKLAGAASHKPKRKFNTLESDITDTFYQITNRNEQPKSIRVSRDNLLKPPRYIAINKQRISDLYIHNPSSMYDLRLSLSFEHPIDEDSIDSVMKKNKPTLTRIKKRNSWSHNPTVTKFDMTRVLIPKEIRNKSGKPIVEQEQSFEVELEVDTTELFNGFDMFKSGSDSIRFEELVEIFINNARCLNNRVTKLANK